MIVKNLFNWKTPACSKELTGAIRIGVLAVSATALALIIAFRPGSWEATASASTKNNQAQLELARMGDEVTVHAAGRGNPFINLSDGRELITPYSGPPELTTILQRNEARPLSLCSADFDEDGVPDLISGYAGPNGGIITLLRGNVDSIYPNAPEAQQRRAEGTFTDAPFLSPAFAFAVPEAADFIGAGDFDGDGHWDVVTATHGSGKLNLMSGDGKGGLRQTKRIDLPGGVTAMIVGEINRRDGLDDVVVGVSGGRGAKVLVFEGPEGALRAAPEEFAVAAEATSLALGQLDESYEMDLAIADGSELMIVHGRDRRLSLDARRQAEVRPAVLSHRSFARKTLSVAIGDFTGRQNGNDLAIALSDGTLHTLIPDKIAGDSSATSSWLAQWRDEESAALSSGLEMRLVSARISDAPCDSLIGVDSTDRRLQLIGRFGQSIAINAQMESRRLNSTSVDVESTPIAVLPMRLSEDALSELVVLNSGQSRISIASTQPQQAFVVINTNDSGAGSLRQAIIDANNSAGADTISFNIPGAGTRTIILQSVLPVVTGAVTIDGATQPGFSGSPLIALRRGATGSTLKITGGNSTIRSLDICSSTDGADGQPAKRDIEIASAGVNKIEGNIISEAGILVSSSNNTIGGTATGAGNAVAANDGSSGLLVSGQLAAANQIQGNSFVRRLPSCAPTIGCPFGISVTIQVGANNIIGGTLPQSRNVIAGTAFLTNLVINGASGTLVQGNLIGLDAAGTFISGSPNCVKVAGGIGTTIGGTSPQARNVISGSSGNDSSIETGAGVYISSDGTAATGNLVQGNYIGTDSTGSRAVGNQNGVVLVLARGTTVGGATVSARNIISGNRGSGIVISSVQSVSSAAVCVILCCPTPPPGSSADFQVLNNYIGADVAGGALPNLADGVRVDISAFSHELRNNLIGFNGGKGVSVAETSSGSGAFSAFRIGIFDNAIFSNAGLGIDLGNNGVTANDPLDADSGANLRQNFPVLSSSSVLSIVPDGDFSPATLLSVSGTFNSTPNSTFTLQFFFGSGCDASGHQFIGAIPLPLGSMAVTTNAIGNAAYSFSFDFPSGKSSGFVNSSATDVSGNTSEFSTCLEVTNPLRITSACKGDGKELKINGVGFANGAKVFLNGDQEKTSFRMDTLVIAKKAGKRATDGDMLKVRNPNGSETEKFMYMRNNCPP